MHFWFLLQDRGKSSQIVPKDATRATGVEGLEGILGSSLTHLWSLHAIPPNYQARFTQWRTTCMTVMGLTNHFRLDLRSIS